MNNMKTEQGLSVKEFINKGLDENPYEFMVVVIDSVLENPETLEYGKGYVKDITKTILYLVYNRKLSPNQAEALFDKVKSMSEKWVYNN